MTQQVKDQIKGFAIVLIGACLCIFMQYLYVRALQAEDAVKGYERRAEKATHVIDSLEATNAHRMLEIELLEKELNHNKEVYEANISAIDSLDRNGLRRAMHSLLAELTSERYPGQSND